jgi:hypothetical protein
MCPRQPVYTLKKIEKIKIQVLSSSMNLFATGCMSTRERGRMKI